jgi:hypothetical protein
LLKHRRKTIDERLEYDDQAEPTPHESRPPCINSNVKMIDLSKLPNSTYASSIDEAMILVRRCAEPSPAGDPVKAAVRRASRQVQIPFVRARAIWYGEARRIDAEEMDRLRRGAEKADLAQALAAIEFLTKRLLTSHSSASQRTINSLRAALLSDTTEALGDPA